MFPFPSQIVASQVDVCDDEEAHWAHCVVRWERSNPVWSMCPAQAEECSAAFGSKRGDWGCDAFENHTMAEIVAKAESMPWCVFHCTLCKVPPRRPRTRTFINPHVVPP